MYAVVETGGKQYKVAIGDKLKVEKLIAEEGDSINVGRVLMIADGDKVDVGAPTLDVAVTATVVGHGRGKKIRVFKMKRRKNYRRTQGHRQAFTELEITGIGDAKAEPKSKAAAKSKTDKPKADKPKSDKPKAEEKKAAPAAKAEAKSGDDKLTDINGIGPVIEGKLHEIGVTTFQQIADFDQARIDEIDEQLNFKGRIEREEWVSQAKELIKK